MGTEGRGQHQFTRELYACPQLPIEGSYVDNNDLDIFTRDTPFNFAVEQALERLEDLGMLAEVGQLRTLCARIPVYAKLVQSVQDLSTAMHKFHKHFNDQVGQMVVQLEATKGRMEKARVHARIQQELSELVKNREL